MSTEAERRVMGIHVTDLPEPTPAEAIRTMRKRYEAVIESLVESVANSRAAYERLEAEATALRQRDYGVPLGRPYISLSDAQWCEFLSVAFRHVTIVGTLTLADLRQALAAALCKDEVHPEPKGEQL